MNQTIPIEYHPLEPFLPNNGRLLMLGSFPPQPKRWSMQFFYPNIQNDMWRIMGTLYFADKDYFVDPTKKKFRYEQVVGFCNEIGLGIYDTASAIRRLADNAADKFLEVVEPTDVIRLMESMPHCHAIVTTGQKATETLCELLQCDAPKVGEKVLVEYRGKMVSFYRMPSSSRAYPLSLDKKAVYYGAMLRELEMLK